jgi:hypothetical protein
MAKRAADLTTHSMSHADSLIRHRQPQFAASLIREVFEVNLQLLDCVTVVDISGRFRFSYDHFAIDSSAGKYVGANLT